MELTVKDVFEKFGNIYLEKYNTNYEKLNVFNNIKTCRTSSQGIRIYKCNDCGKKIYTYRSCMDRHCPTCLEYKKEVWLENHKQDILDIKYYHMVILVPRGLYPLFYYNQKVLYDLFFKVSSDIIEEANLKSLGINVGITSILHTWSQKGKYYPHIHMLVTGGGVDKLGRWKPSDLVDPEMIQTRFKKRFIQELKKLRLEFYSEHSKLNNYDNYINFLDNFKEEFICYKKEPYNNVLDIYEYFAKYAFKVCITNDRIKKMDNKYVYFTYKNYENKNEEKISKVKGEEFIRRFLMHTLSKSFIKIRYYGIMSCKNKQKKMNKLRLITRTRKIEDKLRTKIEILKTILSDKDITKCPFCGGELYLYKEYYLNKSPPKGNYQNIFINN